MAKNRQNAARVLASIVMMFAAAVVLQLAVNPATLSKEAVVVWVFDVGQGDAIFIDAPDVQILIDGGRNGEVLEKLSAVMPFWDRTIDVVINTHPHADHVTGLNYVLERYEVDEVWVSGQEYGTDTFIYFESLADQEVVFSGEVLDLGEGAQLEVLWPLVSLDGERLNDPNAGSIVTSINYGETSILLTGDIGADEELHLLSKLDHIDVLKVGHQGSKTSSASGFIQHVDPDYAVISVGENDYGHPHQVVLDRLQEVGSWILRTDHDGDVRIVTSGGEPEVATFDL